MIFSKHLRNRLIMNKLRNMEKLTTKKIVQKVLTTKKNRIPSIINNLKVKTSKSNLLTGGLHII